MLGKWQEALTADDTYLELFPGSWEGRTIQFRGLVQLGRRSEATALLDAMQKEFPDRAKEIDNLRRSLSGNAQP
jgi:hypothetical protein